MTQFSSDSDESGDPAQIGESNRLAMTQLDEVAERLLSWPTDSHALLGLALALEEARHVRDATRAFGLLGTLACESGQLSLGILAARSLERCGTEAIGRELAGKLARSYSAGSPRIDPQVGMRPPVPPGHRQARGTSPKGELSPDLVLAKVDSALAKVDEATSSMASKEAKLPAIPFAQTLAAPVLERLISMIQVRLWRKDQVVVDTGDEARSMFWVADGRLRVSRGEHELGYLRAGSLFGEIALLGGTRRTARVACTDDCWLLEIPRDALETAAEEAPELADTLAAYARSRLLGNTLRTSPIFRSLSEAERALLVGRFVPEVYEAGAVIIKEGDEGGDLHLIVSGSVHVELDGVVISELTAGNVFGEMSLVTRRPASADIVAVTRTVTLAVDRASFDEIAVANPTLLAEVYKLIVKRDDETNQIEILDATDDMIVT